MKLKNFLLTLCILILLITACRTENTPQPTLQSQTDIPEETEPVPQESSQPASTTSLPSATPDILNLTDNPAVNTTIAALLDQDLEVLQNALLLNSQPCTTQDGLGGPPKCPEGVNEGTMLSFFPILSPGEGSQLKPDELDQVFDYQEPSLLAVVLVKPPEYMDPSFPAGNYAVILGINPMELARTFRLNHQGKIVRLDYIAWPAEQEISDIPGEILYQK